jgi:hypothetical protein
MAAGTAKRIFEGLSGPDMTLGTEAVSQVGRDANRPTWSSGRTMP